MRPRCSIVAKLPLKIPPIPPLIVRIGGKRAKIQGLCLNWGVKIAINPPANKLMVLKLSPMRV